MMVKAMLTESEEQVSRPAFRLRLPAPGSSEGGPSRLACTPPPEGLSDFGNPGKGRGGLTLPGEPGSFGVRRQVPRRFGGRREIQESGRIGASRPASGPPEVARLLMSLGERVGGRMEERRLVGRRFAKLSSQRHSRTCISDFRQHTAIKSSAI